GPHRDRGGERSRRRLRQRGERDARGERARRRAAAAARGAERVRRAREARRAAEAGGARRGRDRPAHARVRATEPSPVPVSVHGHRIAILGHLGRAQVKREAIRLRDRLAKKGAVVRMERELANGAGETGESLPVLARWCQTLISLGGDGTVLTAGRALAGQKGVLLAVNLGGLGFLAAAEAGEVDDAVDAALAGRWRVATRTGVETRVPPRRHPPPPPTRSRLNAP